MIRSSHGSKVLRRLLIGALALLIPVLAGCEAGNNAPTLEFHPAANGAYGTADPVTVDNAFILGGQNNTLLASGSSASMFLYLYNSSGSADKLTSVSAPGTATSVQITGGSVTVPAHGSSRPERPRAPDRAARSDQRAAQREDGHRGPHLPERRRAVADGPSAGTDVVLFLLLAASSEGHFYQAGDAGRERYGYGDPEPGSVSSALRESLGERLADPVAAAPARGPLTRQPSRTCSRGRARSRCAADLPGRLRSWPAAA